MIFRMAYRTIKRMELYFKSFENRFFPLLQEFKNKFDMKIEENRGMRKQLNESRNACKLLEEEIQRLKDDHDSS